VKQEELQEKCCRVIYFSMYCACLLLKGSLVVYPHILTFRKPSPILMCVGGFCWSVLENSIGVRVRVWGCHGGGGWVGVRGYVCVSVCVRAHVCACTRAHSVHVGASYVKMSLQ